MAQRGGEYMTGHAQRYTPVDTGATRESFYTVPVHRVPGGYRSGTASDSRIARYLESGVRPHEELPVHYKAEMTPEGPRADVHHGGFVGHHMVTRAAADLEAFGSEALRPEAERWAEETEALAKSHKGVT